MVELQLASGQQNNNLQTAAVVALGKPADLRDEDIELSVKVVIVGNGAVGKSSMIQVSLRSNVDFGSLNSFKCDIKVPKSWKDCCLQILTF